MPRPRYFFLSSFILLFIQTKVLVSVQKLAPRLLFCQFPVCLSTFAFEFREEPEALASLPPPFKFLTTSWKIQVFEFFVSTNEAFLGIGLPGIPANFFGVVNKGAKGARGAGPANTADKRDRKGDSCCIAVIAI